MISARHLVCFILFSPLASGSLLRDDDVPLKKATGGVLPAGRSLGKVSYILLDSTTHATDATRRF
jgi:hypothetical protein